MRISLLQPKIIRGEVVHNLNAIQRLVDKSQGELLILPEYVLTGSLVLDDQANIKEWVKKCKQVISKIQLPDEKKLLINTLIELDDAIYNCCELIPTELMQCKMFPDKTELESGIKPGSIEQLFESSGFKFKIIICTDLRYIDRFDTEDLDFLIYVFHFTHNNFKEAIEGAKKASLKGIPVFISSLVSDKNIGYSSYVNSNTVVSLPNVEGILEIAIEKSI